MTKRKKTLLTITVLILLSSCGGFNAMNGANPRKKSFKYYTAHFKTDSLSTLKTGRKYVLTKDSAVNILVFFNDGFLNQYSTNDVSHISGIRQESGVIMGYYKLKSDSIFFTTRSYYEHRATRYRGLINNDTIYLETTYPRGKKRLQEKYVLD
jgi:hypothetical protein